MQSQMEEPVRNKMESLRLICEGEIPMHQQKMDAFMDSFERSLESVKARAKGNAQNQAKLAHLKAHLRESEDELVKVLAVKTRNEAQQISTRDSLSATKAKKEQLERAIQIQRARRDEYAAIISQQSLALVVSEDKGKQDCERREEIQEAISWYNRFLGFQIDGGHGVKFTFKNINAQNRNEEYSFTIRHANDTYILLDCNPQINDTKELIHELNQTNGLFKYVRIMRQKFQEAAGHGSEPHSKNLHQEFSSISLSAPAFSVSTDQDESLTLRSDFEGKLREENRLPKEVHPRSDTSEQTNDYQIDDGKFNTPSKKVNRGRGAKSTFISPESVSTRRSSRLKVKK